MTDIEATLLILKKRFGVEELEKQLKVRKTSFSKEYITLTSRDLQLLVFFL
jgi:hypothetical protein